MTERSGTSGSDQWSGIDTSVAHTARVWNYWLGGKDNYPVDREVGEQILTLMPDIVDTARHDRGFLGRAVRYLVGEVGIRQFLDIGTGLPTADNTHEVAQAVAPQCRIVDDDEAYAIVNRLLDALPSGSYLVLSHPTTEVDRAAALEVMRLWNESATPPIKFRSHQELIRLFDRLELLEPGVVSCCRWRPDPSRFGIPAEDQGFGGVGRKP